MNAIAQRTLFDQTQDGLIIGQKKSAHLSGLQPRNCKPTQFDWHAIRLTLIPRVGNPCVGDRFINLR